MAQPTYFGSTSNPADNGTLSAATVAVTPVASMQDGDLCVLVTNTRTPADAMSISATGGQTWVSETKFLGPVTVAHVVHWCRFNGTWSANPSVAFAGAQGTTVAMHVWRPDNSSKLWAIDNAQSAGTYAAPSSPFTVSIPGRTTQHADNVTLAIWSARNDCSFGSIAGTGWVVTGTAQYRNLASNDNSISFAHYIHANAGQATGNVSKNQSVVTGEDGAIATIGWYAYGGANYVSGQLTAAGVATPSLNTKIFRSSPLTSAGVATLTLNPKALKRGNLASDGLATPTLRGAKILRAAFAISAGAATSLAGKTLRQASLTSAGVAATSLATKLLRGGRITSAGVATPDLRSAPVGRVSAAFNIGGVATPGLKGYTIRKVVFASDGIATVALTTLVIGPPVSSDTLADVSYAELSGIHTIDAKLGFSVSGDLTQSSVTWSFDADIPIASLSSAGAATTSFKGLTIRKGPLSVAGFATTTPKGAAIRRSPLTVAGAATTALTSRKFGQGSFAISGTATATFLAIGPPVSLGILPDGTYAETTGIYTIDAKLGFTVEGDPSHANTAWSIDGVGPPVSTGSLPDVTYAEFSGIHTIDARTGFTVVGDPSHLSTTWSFDVGMLVGALSSAGVATPDLKSKTIRRSSFAIAASTIPGLKGTGIRKVAFAIAGTAAPSLKGTAYQKSAFAIAGTATTALKGAARAITTFSSAGVATPSLKAKSTTRASFTVFAVATPSFSGLSVGRAVGSFAMAGVATLSLKAKSTTRASFTVFAAATTGLAGQALRYTTLTAAGAATTSLKAAARVRSTLTAAGAATTALKGAARVKAAFTSAGVATTTLAGFSTGRSIGSLVSAGVATTSLKGVRLARSALAAAGVASPSLRGVRISKSPFGAIGVATPALKGQKIVRGALASAGVAATGLASKLLRGGRFTIAGVAATALASKQRASGRLTSAGVATPGFNSTSIGPVTATFAMTGAASTSLKASWKKGGALSAAGSASTILVGANSAIYTVGTFHIAAAAATDLDGGTALNVIRIPGEFAIAGAATTAFTSGRTIPGILNSVAGATWSVKAGRAGFALQAPRQKHRYASIPTQLIDPNNLEGLSTILSSLRERVQIVTRDRGDLEDSMISVEDLVKLGVIKPEDMEKLKGYKIE